MLWTFLYNRNEFSVLFYVYSKVKIESRKKDENVDFFGIDSGLVEVPFLSDTAIYSKKDT